jgi:Leucine-rich repeat (LRR) protein
LKYLHIANSGFTVINKKTFNECGKLEFLDASHNEINHIDDDSLRNCTMLRVIDLTGNPIDYVSGGLYQLDPALERVHLQRHEDWALA